MKKIVSLMVAVLMVVLLLPMTAMATPAETYVAQVGDASFDSLQRALEIAIPGNTVKLLENVTLENMLSVKESITIDLGGKTITRTGANGATGWFAFQVTNGATVTIKNGTINSSDSGIDVLSGTLTTENLVITGTVDGGYGVQVQNGTANLNQGTNIYSCDDGVFCGCKTAGTVANININGASITAKEVAVKENGSYAGIATIVVNSGNLKSDDILFYLPSKDSLTINDGTFEATTVIYQKAGSVTVNGGTFIATGEKKGYEYDGNGWVSTGDAVVIDDCGYPYADGMSMSITGGTFKSANANAVAYYQYNGASNFTNKNFITGGSFSTNPTNFLSASKSAEYDTATKLFNVVDSELNKAVEVEDVATPAPEVPAALENKISEDVKTEIADESKTNVEGIGAAIDEEKLINSLPAEGVTLFKDTNIAKIEIEVKAEVKLVDYDNTEGQGVIAFTVAPKATITGFDEDGRPRVSYKNRSVDNGVLQGAPIKVTLPCGDIEPKEVVHIRENGALEIFREGDFEYNKEMKTVTITIYDFSEVRIYDRVVHPLVATTPYSPVHQIGTPAASTNEENPNTGAESAIGAVAAIALVSLAAMAISKKK